MTAYYKPNEGFTANDESFYKGKHNLQVQKCRPVISSAPNRGRNNFVYYAYYVRAAHNHVVKMNTRSQVSTLTKGSACTNLVSLSIYVSGQYRN